MAYCTKCGKQLTEDAVFCPSCGTKRIDKNSNTESFNESFKDFSDKFNDACKTTDYTNEFDSQDIANNKAYGILAYLGILVLIPILAAPNSKFARFHANQGLILFISEIIFSVCLGIINTIAHFAFRYVPILNMIPNLLGLLGIVFVVFVILGIINAANGEAKELPIIGKIKIIK